MDSAEVDGKKHIACWPRGGNAPRNFANQATIFVADPGSRLLAIGTVVCIPPAVMKPELPRPLWEVPPSRRVVLPKGLRMQVDQPDPRRHLRKRRVIDLIDLE
jgi:hypothetical protein